MIQEIYKAVKGYEGLYAVSNFGNVKSLSNNKKKKEKILRPGVNSSGYLNVSLTINKKAKSMVVHRIVAAAFLEGLDETTEANHKDGNKQNNRLDNLEVNTRPQNIQHAFRIGLNKGPCGEKNAHSKFKAEDILAIRSLYGTGNYSIGALSRQHKVSQSSMSAIIRRKSYVNV